jgi:hypothetical protein
VDLQLLVDAVNSSGLRSIPSATTTGPVEKLEQALTPHEARIVRMLAEGDSHQKIASERSPAHSWPCPSAGPCGDELMAKQRDDRRVLKLRTPD